jgi:hypothetical protein
LSHASNLRKEIAALVDQWVEENSSAMLARWLMEHRERETPPLTEAAAGHSHTTTPQTAAAAASDNFLSDFVAGKGNHHGQT